MSQADLSESKLTHEIQCVQCDMSLLATIRERLASLIASKCHSQGMGRKPKV